MFRARSRWCRQMTERKRLRCLQVSLRLFLWRSLTLLGHPRNGYLSMAYPGCYACEGIKKTSKAHGKVHSKVCKARCQEWLKRQRKREEDQTETEVKRQKVDPGVGLSSFVANCTVFAICAVWSGVPGCSNAANISAGVASRFRKHGSGKTGTAWSPSQFRQHVYRCHDQVYCRGF